MPLILGQNEPIGLDPSSTPKQSPGLSWGEIIGLGLEGFTSGFAGKQPQGPALLHRKMEMEEERRREEEKLKFQRAIHIPTLLDAGMKLRDRINEMDLDEPTKNQLLQDMGAGWHQLFKDISGGDLGEKFSAGIFTRGTNTLEGLKEIYSFIDQLPERQQQLVTKRWTKAKTAADQQKIIADAAFAYSGVLLAKGQEIPLNIRQFMDDKQRAELSVEARRRGLPEIPVASAEIKRQEAQASLITDEPAQRRFEQREERMEKRAEETQARFETSQVGIEQRHAEMITTLKGKTEFQQTDTLRKEFLKESQTFTEVRDSFNRVSASAEKPSPAGDLSLIFAYMKMLDPKSVTRESEFSVAETARPLLEKLGVSWDRVQSVWEGKKLTDTQRADFVNRAQGLFRQQEQSHNLTVKEFRRLAASSGLDPDKVVVDLKGAESPTAKPSTKPRPLPPGWAPAR